MELGRLKISENRVLWKMCGWKWDDIIRGWRKLHNEELHNFYSLLNTIRTRQRRVSRTANAARKGEEECL
jgi:hypothetical protein